MAWFVADFRLSNFVSRIPQAAKSSPLIRLDFGHYGPQRGKLSPRLLPFPAWLRPLPGGRAPGGWEIPAGHGGTLTRKIPGVESRSAPTTRIRSYNLIIHKDLDAPKFRRRNGQGAESTSQRPKSSLSQGRPYGCLSAFTARERKFTRDDSYFLQAAANVLGLAIERKRHEQDQRERDLLRSDQMATVGQLAAGVAHELRNPLTAVKGLVQVNLREARSRGLPADDLRVIEQEIRRMERTLQAFLDFARPPRPERRRMSLTTLIDQTLALVRGRIDKQKVSLQVLRPASPVVVEGDADQLQQLLLNLTMNALDVVPRRGSLEIELRLPQPGR